MEGGLVFRMPSNDGVNPRKAGLSPPYGFRFSYIDIGFFPHPIAEFPEG